MKKSTRANLSSTVLTTALAGFLAWLYANSRWDTILTDQDRYRVLCDAFSIPGIFLFLTAVMLSLNYVGALDTLAYLLSYIPKMIAPGAFGEPGALYDFVEERKEKRKKGYGFLYVVGLGFLGIAFYFLFRFYSV